MKVTDDYKAKYRLWAENPRVVSLPDCSNIPHFKPQKFSSHKEMNLWKKSLLRKSAQNAANE
jgi:hypothetical protein